MIPYAIVSELFVDPLSSVGTTTFSTFSTVINNKTNLSNSIVFNNSTF
jgi:hypothetical protein